MVLAAVVGVLGLAAATAGPYETAAAGAAPAVGGRGSGGGVGGVSGGAIWSLTWWTGTPLGPGPYIPGPSGGQAVCEWIDLGPAVAGLDAGLAQSSLPLTFWSVLQSGGHPGIWGVDQWAEAHTRNGRPTDHFDLVACRSPSQVPSSGPDIETSLPAAHPPSGGRMWVWVFWDTVPDPPPGHLPPIIGAAFARQRLPEPSLFTSPSEVGGFPRSTVVFFPTWLWIGSGIWRVYVARAAGGGYVATVWAVPVGVAWTAAWDFPAAATNPEGGVSLAPERLAEMCDGPGEPYRPGSGDAGAVSRCSFVFTEPTFGTRQPLTASIEWEVHWAFSSAAGIVGGEGVLGTVHTASSIWLRVLQIESIISAG